MVLKEMILTVSILGGCCNPERNDFYVFTVGGHGGLEGTDFKQFLYWEGMVVLKELVL